MSSTTDKIKGTANEVAGKAKQGVGDATDNQHLKNEGDAQEIKGKGQKVVGDVKDGVKKAGNL
ncbi:UPF0337 protein bsl2407 [Pseudomonas asuensis]|jgi:uncharacterized protein YjbJ (UPF0337 family)|uniref:UPF0337 protein bsl2407 n=1 Tax=Pseudomonas asuensis TaxID=1825787 RepID=A0ABQ2GEY8_9PSED|nr:CsbD family protein [Pseudomonas asuensis]GGL93161.1 UPF0337 protein bsl2407 [Pseudomonas asuensis]